MVAAQAAVDMVWEWFYNNHFGLINHLLRQIGISGVDWVNDADVALISIVIIGIWSIIGYNVVLILAGLQEIPKGFYEASMIDGAGKIYQFFKITLPLLSPTLFFIMVTTII